jgi:Fur family iron response transcriptional regulator
MLRSDILVRFNDLDILSTPQRVEIAGILLEKPQHLSAEQIIDRLRASGSRVSKATVYNTLNLFRDRGLTRSGGSTTPQQSRTTTSITSTPAS